MSSEACYCCSTDLCQSVQSFDMILEIKMKHLLHQCLAECRLHLYFELINEFGPRCGEVPSENLQGTHRTHQTITATHSQNSTAQCTSHIYLQVKKQHHIHQTYLQVLLISKPLLFSTGCFQRHRRVFFFLALLLGRSCSRSCRRLCYDTHT